VQDVEVSPPSHSDIEQIVYRRVKWHCFRIKTHVFSRTVRLTYIINEYLLTVVVTNHVSTVAHCLCFVDMRHNSKATQLHVSMNPYMKLTILVKVWPTGITVN
jgi:hypothetical protein